MKRQFSKEEARRIFADAAERQQAAQPEDNEYLTLEELEESATAAGIDSAYIRAAAENFVRPTRLEAHRRFLGIPVETKKSVLLPFAVGDEEWALIVAEIRSVFKRHGIASEVGTIREWISEASSRATPIRVTLEPIGDETRLTIERSMWRRTLGAGAGSMGIVVASFLLFALSIAGAGEEAWMPALIMLVMGTLFATGVVTTTRLASRHDAKRFDLAIEGIRKIGTERSEATSQIYPNEETRPTVPEPAVQAKKEQLERPPVSLDPEEPADSHDDAHHERRRERL